VREFLKKDLDEEAGGSRWSIVATSNQPALVSSRRFFGDVHRRTFPRAGQNVLLDDGLGGRGLRRRNARSAWPLASRPATRGYTPSVFSFFRNARTAGTPSLLDHRLFTVLVEADDMDEPIADSVRSILDGTSCEPGTGDAKSLPGH